MAPLSEVFGRTPIYITSMFLYFIFTLPSALAKKSATLVIGRLLAGISASAPMCNVDGRWVSVQRSFNLNKYVSIADVWAIEDRSAPMAVFSATTL